jgi:CBS-domain-containing membrane protein
VRTGGALFIGVGLVWSACGIKPHDSVAHARALLEEHRINQPPVLLDNHLVGIVTDRDLRDAPTAVKVGPADAGSPKALEATPDRIPIET